MDRTVDIPPSPRRLRRLVNGAFSLVLGLLGAWYVYAGIAHSIYEYPYEQSWGISLLGMMLVALAMRMNAVGHTRRIASIAAVLTLISFGMWCVTKAPDDGLMSRRVFVTVGLSFATGVQSTVAEFYQDTGRLPNATAAVRLTPSGPVPDDVHVENIAVSDGGIITVTFGGAARDRRLTGTSIALVPTIRGDQLDWDCRGGSMPARYRPLRCR